MQRAGVGNWILSLALGIVNTIFAFLLILNPFDGVTALMIYMGIMLIIRSIENLHMIHCISKAFKENVNHDVIDVSWKPVE